MGEPMWTYVLHNGSLYDSSNTRVAIGYSGAGHGKNDPADEEIVGVGPIPEGEWHICEPRDTATHGPYVLPLVAGEGTDTHGRSGFLIHGDSIKSPGTASRGCIILSRPIRESIWESGDHKLLVIR